MPAKRAGSDKRGLDRLTRGQVAAIRAARDRWTELGFSTAPADRPSAEQGVRLAYRAAGLKAPAVVWHDSPLAGATEVRALAAKGRPERHTRIRERLDARVASQVHARLGLEARLKIDRGFDHFDDPTEVYGGVWYALWERAWSPVQGQLIEDLEPIDDEARDRVLACFSGCDTDWLAECDFYLELGAFERLEIVAGLTQVARSSGWWWPLEGVAVLTERPQSLTLGRSGLPSDLAGPAIRYRDGWEFWSEPDRRRRRRSRTRRPRR